MKRLLKEHEEKRRGKKTAAENVVTFIFLQPVISFQGHGSMWRRPGLCVAGVFKRSSIHQYTLRKTISGSNNGLFPLEGTKLCP